MTNNQSHSSCKPEFTIQRIYVKDLSLEVPHSPQVFQNACEPEMDIKFAIKTYSLEADNHEVILEMTINVAAKSKDEDKDNVLFLIEVKQAGLFTLQGFSHEDNEQILNITCPTILFPYVREAVSNLVSRATFPPLYLAPVNFEALYLQQKQSREKDEIRKKESAQESTTH